MNPVTRHLLHNHTQVSEHQAHKLQKQGHGYTIEARPPQDTDLPTTLQQFLKGIRELQTDWFGLKNASPITAFEIRRKKPEKLRFQYTAPTKRLERKIRLHLTNQIPKIELVEGTNGLPIQPGDTIGGGFLTNGRNDYHPFQYEHQNPPNNSLAATLHRHAMQDTKFIIQILFQPVIGHSLKNWWWRKSAYRHRNYLNKEKEQFWGTTKPTPREKKQAREIDNKTGETRFKTTLRLLTINAGQHTPSRLKELAGAFNTYENPETGQYFDLITINRLREKRILNFAETIAQRQFGNWIHGFQLSTKELAALLTLPQPQQNNIQPAHP